jgi:Flp pilus assembly protein TadB
VGAATTFDKVISFAQNPVVLLVIGAIVILLGLLLTRRGRGAREPEVATPRAQTNGSRSQAPRQRTPEERRRMHEERMRRRRERAEREEGTG